MQAILNISYVVIYNGLWLLNGLGTKESVELISDLRKTLSKY